MTSFVSLHSQSGTSVLRPLREHLFKAGSLLHAVHGRKNSNRIRVAIPFSEATGWTAQQSLTRCIVTALRITAEEMDGELQFLLLPRKGATSPFDGVPRDLRLPLSPIDWGSWQNDDSRRELLDAFGVSVVLNLYLPPVALPGCGNIGWIYDFQHVHLPHYFSQEERNYRDARFRNVAEKSDLVILSSNDATRDFAAFAPEFAGKGRCHPFPSGLAFTRLPKGNPEHTAQKYSLPAKFALVANQFWAHKNHQVVIDAVALCLSRGIKIPVAMTGLPLDHRDSSNAYVSEVLQGIAKAGVQGLVIPLGLVPYSDLINLLRCSVLIIQPSRMEGWSTSVQDAKALGKTVACADLPVLREQAPDCAGFFGCDDPEALAEVLLRVWNMGKPGYDIGWETDALKRAGIFARNYGVALWKTCREASDTHTAV